MKRILLWSFLILFGAANLQPVATQKRDYLTAPEADKIRDAETTDLRIKLFLEFAEDRLKKFDYELHRGHHDRRRAERLNALLNAYVGCVDDAAELIDLGREKQEEIRSGIQRMKTKATEFLAYLKSLLEKGPELESYRETLEDAILGTEDALAEARKAEEEYAPPPVRRRPS
ncbi:MAG: hypothetical protein K6U09_04550 [Acidobacteriia bacterium]|jgi:chromosome segregation ATPase|nr:hypothetical protein [Terriglobia bacterium]